MKFTEIKRTERNQVPPLAPVEGKWSNKALSGIIRCAKVSHLATLVTIAAAGVCSTFSAHAGLDTFNGLNVNLVGDATIPNSGSNAGNLLLTPSTSGAVGAAWLTTPVSTTSAFSTTFSFNLANVGGIGNADGLALVFHNSGTSALGSSGGFLGIDLPDNTTPGGAVAAVLQTFWNGYGIVQNTDATGGPFTHSIPVGAPIDLSTALLITGTETVAYDPATQTVSQNMNLGYTDGTSSGSFPLSTSANFDLGSLFGPTMTMGLSAATGAGTTDQAVTSWTVSGVPEPGSALFGLALCCVSLLHRRRG